MIANYDTDINFPDQIDSLQVGRPHGKTVQISARGLHLEGNPKSSGMWTTLYYPIRVNK